MDRLASEASDDCGTVEISRWDDEEDAGSGDAGTDGPTVQQCIASALEDGRPFTAVIHLQGIDSSVSVGWVQTDAGALYRLNSDSNICGGVGCTDTCGPRVTLTTCKDPMLAPDDRDIIECGSRETETLCAPPGHSP